MPYALGSAISTNYKVPQADIAGSVFRGYQVGQMENAKREAARLKREAEKAKEDAEFDKSLSSIDIKDVHPYVLPKVREEIAPLIQEATNLYRADPRKNHIKISRLLQDAQNKAYEGKSLSANITKFDTTPEEKLSGAAREFKNRLHATGDVRALNGSIDPITGEGFNNNQLNFKIKDYTDINKARNAVLANVTQDIISQKSLGGYQREFKYGIPKEVVEQTAKEFWGDENLRDTYINENREYILNKYYKDLPKDQRSLEALQNNPKVQQDLYNKFLGETEEAAKKFGKNVMDAIPQPRGEFGFNANGYTTKNKWTLTPADTTHVPEEQFNKAFEAVNEGLKKGGFAELSEEQFKQRYPEFNPKPKDYDEVILENQDVSENKTFQFSDGKGGLIDFQPISIRRKKGTDDWETVGKEKVGNRFRDKVLPYDEANKKKVDAIIGTNSADVIRKFYPNTKITSGRSTEVVNSGKELKGTSSQLEAAAKKKGLTKDAYKAELKKAGYNVIEN